MENHVDWFAGSITEKDGDFSWMDGSDWDFELWDEGLSEEWYDMFW